MKVSNKSGKAHCVRGVFGLSALMVAISSQAQAPVQVPGIGDALREVPKVAPVERPAPALPEVTGTQLEPAMKAVPGGGPSIEVARFAFTGNRELSTTELEAQVAGRVGRAYTLADLESLATDLTRFYRSRGYFVARVYVPAQEVENGVVTLRAVEGNYGRFVLDNKSLVRDDIVQGMLDDVKKYDIVSLDTLERAMLIINDTPGVQVTRADVMPGDAVGTSDFAVGTAATRRHEGYVLLDNHGTLATGRERLSFNWDWNSPTGRGDRLSLSGLGSHNADLLNARVAYSTTLAPSGWRGEAALSRTNYSLGDQFSTLDAQGFAIGFDLGATYPIRRIRAQTIELGLNYAYRDLEDEVGVTDTDTSKNSQVMSARISLRDERTLFGAEGLTQGTLQLSAGRLDITDRLTRDIDQAPGGADTHGSFVKLNANLSRMSLLPAGFTLTGSIRYQQALGGKNLDGSERMGISGPSGVRAYTSGESAGTDAALVGLALSRPLPAIGDLTHQWSLFANWGQARTLKSDPYRELSDVGVSWTAAHTNGLYLNLQLAHRTTAAAVTEADRQTRVLFQLGMLF